MRSRPKPRKSIGVLAMISVVSVFQPPKPVFAEPTSGKCSGVLHQSREGIMFGGGKGEDEGICIVSKTEVSKVLAVCRVGRRCLVEGLVDDCIDSGECTEIKGITSVRRK